MELSVYGSTGFIGKNFIKFFPGNKIIPREGREPKSNDILYFISTTDNFNIMSDTSIDVNTNLSVLCEVLNYCKSEDIIFNFISSWFVYGNLDNLPANEKSNCDPRGFYSITKKCAEDLLISFSETFNCKYRVIRLCNVLGIGDENISNKKNVLTWMINKLKNNELIELYENGETSRDIMHVKDVCNAINLICTKGKTNEIYNVGSGKPISMGEFINLARYKLNSKSEIKYVNTPITQSKVVNKHFWMDNSKLKSLGFEIEFTNDLIIDELCS
jgi:nucleoside-diphosphate-sugar epimerase